MGWSRGSQPYVTIDQQGEYLESSFHSNAAVFLAVSQEPLLNWAKKPFLFGSRGRMGFPTDMGQPYMNDPL